MITEILGPAFRKEVIDKLKAVKFSIIIDETTDIGIKKSFVIVARYWSDEYKKVIDRYVDLVEVELYVRRITFYLKEFASDNANVMMGAIKGVQAKIKELAPYIYFQGCSCHSFHLCSSPAASKLPNSVEQFVRDIYSYFSHSIKRIAELRECEIFAEETRHSLLHPSQTRWLSLKVLILFNAKNIYLLSGINL